MTASLAQELDPQTRPRNPFAFGLATWFGCGLLPFAPATWAAAVATAIGWTLHSWFGVGQLGLCVLVLTTIGPAMWASGVVARSRGTRDPDMVVVDEVIGQWVVLAGVTTLDWSTALMAFLLFRAFDIWKPPPVRHLERLPGGLGIVADDVMAGAYSVLAIYLIDLGTQFL